MLPVIAKDAGMDVDATAATMATFVFPSVDEQLSEKWLGGGAQAFMKGVAEVFVKPVRSTAPATAMIARSSRPAQRRDDGQLSQKKSGGPDIGPPSPLRENKKIGGYRVTNLLIDDISMRFDLPNGTHVQALKNVTLDIKEGELMSVLGPSGCGKTTLLNIVAGFLAPTEGKVVLEQPHSSPALAPNAGWCSSRAHFSNG